MVARPNHPIEKVRELQRRLYIAAKCNQERRFHALYDRIWRSDVLLEAWKRVRSNKGAAGIDGETLAMIEQQGVAAVPRGTASHAPCREVSTAAGAAAVHSETRRASSGRWAFRRCEIAWCRWRRRSCSSRSSKRTFSRAATASVRAGAPRKPWKPSGSRAAAATTTWWTRTSRASSTRSTRTSCMEKLAARISDRRVLKLLRQWLRAGVMEDGTVRTSTAGTPQGGVISPLLANVYLNDLDRIWTATCSHLGQAGAVRG